MKQPSYLDDLITTTESNKITQSDKKTLKALKEVWIEQCPYLLVKQLKAEIYYDISPKLNNYVYSIKFMINILQDYYKTDLQRLKRKAYINNLCIWVDELITAVHKLDKLHS